jgi:hypothetical protein
MGITHSAAGGLAATLLALTAVLAPIASATPAGFPNLDAYVEAPPSIDFSRPDRWANGYAFFRTPDGLNCMAGPLSRCSGALPGVGPEFATCGEVSRTDGQGGRSQPFALRALQAAECEVGGTDPVLEVGQKLTLAGNHTTTCVVGADRLTACIENDHGFVLQPSGSWVF